MTKINIIFSTKNEENTNNIIESIIKSNSFDYNKNYILSIVIFDKTLKQSIESKLECFALNIKVINFFEIQELEKKYSHFFSKANCSTRIDSIQRARIQQQIFIIENFETFKDSIIWQVDDDMLFGRSQFRNNKHTANYSTNYFSEIVNLYHQNENIDAIISPSTYVPPIPSLLYCESQLNAFFKGNHIPKNTTIQSEYHDYYNLVNSNNNYSVLLSNTEDKTTIVKDILIGKPITKISFVNNINITPEFTRSKFLRGGNFIVFNSEIFHIPHLGFSESNNIPARRSDMIHSHLLTEIGFQLRDVSFFSLVHNRTFSNSSIENSSEKYFSDMIGALLVSYLYKGETEFTNRLLFYQKHIKNILELLYENINKNEFKNEIDRLIELDIQINSFDRNYFIKEFKKFKLTQENLKLQLCKLAL
ncbi:hypothetical protein F6A46_11400 [Tenacibaculum finnmarkense genomovar ulcerans]|uniref:hypothetical protein n=1 Tax=Tenacibaculum finnmarkense TaxID=2781243 RepID=UPI00187B6FB0|nr:hypothetical protein [Tenacibaculum finnmarkense]MBE7688828.1 hypothetical protein [Tenacibaculum finnmarkense genomovar ulcerans]